MTFIAPPPPGFIPPPPPVAAFIPPPPPPPPTTVRIPLMCDTECYPNYWLIKFYDPNQPGKVMYSFDMYDGKPLDIAGILRVLRAHTIVTFNGNHYDVPMITLALSGASCAQLKAANDRIIVFGGKGLKPWEFYDVFRLEELFWLDHIDIKEVAPGVNVSLKTYGGRLGCDELQDLPYKPSTVLTRNQMIAVDDYCGRDLLNTYRLYKQCLKSINLRIRMTAKYGVDLRSKSDAQIAEAIIKSQLGFKPAKKFWPHGSRFKYKPPSFIKFNTPHLCAMLDAITQCEFITSDKDQVDEPLDANGNKITTGILMPQVLKDMRIAIGSSVYKMGIGGLHSMESARYYISNALYKLSDHDVQSYYPSLILICAMFPEQLGIRFLQIYKAIYDERLSAKALSQEIQKEIDRLKAAGLTDISALEEQMLIAAAESDAKKIVLNGTFGKLGSKYSIMFAPDLLIQVTITGQLSLLMLIESLESAGIPVVSANTDGIVVKCPVGMEMTRDILIKTWEGATGLITEESSYAALYSRDVNNYIAFKYDGKAKTKGTFSKAGVTKNPTNNICVAAVIDYLGKGTPLETTIKGCTDIKDFLTIRNVKGGGIKKRRGPTPQHSSKEQLVTMAGYREEFEGWFHNTHDANVSGFKGFTLAAAYKLALESTRPILSVQYLGKVVRWYYGIGEVEGIEYESNGNQVSKSEGAIPLMDLTTTMPADLDYDRYIQEAKDMLATLGFVIQ